MARHGAARQGIKLIHHITPRLPNITGSHTINKKMEYEQAMSDTEFWNNEKYSEAMCKIIRDEQNLKQILEKEYLARRQALTNTRQQKITRLYEEWRRECG